MPLHCHILLVDADPDVGSALVDLLEEEGYRVTHALNLKGALEALSSGERPDLLLVDLRTDGLSLLAHLRTDAALSALPLVCTSTQPLPQAPPEARALLKKPFTVEQLCACVEAHCPK